MSKLSLSQEATIIRLFRSPQKQGCITNRRTAAALIRKGYIVQLVNVKGRRYELLQAGIRYYQTGKEIGQ